MARTGGKKITIMVDESGPGLAGEVGGGLGAECCRVYSYNSWGELQVELIERGSGEL